MPVTTGGTRMNACPTPTRAAPADKAMDATICFLHCARLAFRACLRSNGPPCGSGMDYSIVLHVLGALLIVIGLAGSVLPALPGTPMMFVGMLLVAWGTGFTTLGWGVLAILGALTALSLVLDFVANLLGAKRAGASRLALIGAALGTLIGFFFGLAGILLGPFIGAFAGEYIHSRHGGMATRVGIGTWVGILLGLVARVSIAFLMLGIFALALVL